MHFKHVLFISSLLTASTVSASCLHGTSLLRRQEVEGGKVKVSDFGYTGLQGPLNWAGLSENNSACASSANQSPINIDNSIQLAQVAPKITIDNVEEAEFENLGTTVEVIVNGSTAVGDKVFNLKQFHFHTPSEHRINEQYFPLEVHMVHEAADGSGGIAVIAVIFELTPDGSTTELLTSVTQNLQAIIEPGTVTKTGPLEFGPLIEHLQTKPLFQYQGSLTTPPCAEGLTFFVTEEPLPLNVETFLAIKNVVKFNSRYTQNNLGDANLLQVAAEQLTGAQIANKTAINLGGQQNETIVAPGEEEGAVVLDGQEGEAVGDEKKEGAIILGGKEDKAVGAEKKEDAIILGGKDDKAAGAEKKEGAIILGGQEAKTLVGSGKEDGAAPEGKGDVAPGVKVVIDLNKPAPHPKRDAAATPPWKKDHHEVEEKRWTASAYGAERRMSRRRRHHSAGN